MGHMVETSLARHGIELAGATDDVCSVPDDVAAESICVDFTTPEAFRSHYPEIARTFKAAVVGTTGWYDIKDEFFASFRKEGKTLVWASNFSIGVNALFAAVQRAWDVMKGHGYVPKVDETHHIHKLDAPSGTAKSLADIVERHLEVKPEIEAHRVGEVPGIHTVEFLSGVDKLSFTHEAFSREGFAEGAVYAATLADSVNGVYEFKDLIL